MVPSPVGLLTTGDSFFPRCLRDYCTPVAPLSSPVIPCRTPVGDCRTTVALPISTPVVPCRTPVSDCRTTVASLRALTL